MLNWHHIQVLKLQVIWYVQDGSPSLYVLSEPTEKVTHHLPDPSNTSWSMGVQEMFYLRDISQMERESK
jgi:hypothetical protein